MLLVCRESQDAVISDSMSIQSGINSYINSIVRFFLFSIHSTGFKKKKKEEHFLFAFFINSFDSLEFSWILLCHYWTSIHFSVYLFCLLLLCLLFFQNNRIKSLDHHWYLKIFIFANSMRLRLYVYVTLENE